MSPVSPDTSDSPLSSGQSFSLRLPWLLFFADDYFRLSVIKLSRKTGTK
jgi:hypothetical protein